MTARTGGGHLAAAKAVAKRLKAERGGVAVSIVDILASCPFPFDRLADWYPVIVRRGRRRWGLGFKMSNGRLRSLVLALLCYLYVRRGLRRMVAEHPAELVISTFPILNEALVRCYGRRRPLLVIVVGDIAEPHAWWFHGRADIYAVADDTSRLRAVAFGVPPPKVRVTGFPVDESFGARSPDAAEMRSRLGWRKDTPVVFVLANSGGAWSPFDVVDEIARSKLDCQLAVGTGRDGSLLKSIASANWPAPVFAYGFVDDLSGMLRASDILVTKAGSASLSEAFTLGLPVILGGAILGQEEPNIGYVVGHRAGLWAPSPRSAVAALSTCLGPRGGPSKLREMALNSRKLGSPEASKKIAVGALHLLELDGSTGRTWP